MRRFVTVSHTVDPSGAWSLDDLAGTGGRVDVLCRNVQSALFLSHGLRKDAQFYAVCGNRSVRLAGDRIQRLNPDERSTAARLQQALRDPWAAPDWKEVQAGLAVARLGLQDLLEELPGERVLLDPEGTDIRDWDPPRDVTFLLSDHVPFKAAEYAAIEQAGATRVSLGPHWYHGNHAIAVANWWMDLRDGPATR